MIAKIASMGRAYAHPMPTAPLTKGDGHPTKMRSTVRTGIPLARGLSARNGRGMRVWEKLCTPH